MEAKEKETLKEEKITDKDEFILYFSKPYMFEGKEYKEVDLSGMKNLTVADMSAAENRTKQGGLSKTTNPIIEYTLDYACNIAAKAAKLPIEFFMGLPITEGMALKGIVRDFLF